MRTMETKTFSAHRLRLRSSSGRALLALVLLLCLPSLGVCRENPLSARVTSQLPTDSEPGRILPLSLSVANNSGEDLDLEESLEVPAGWLAIMPVSRFALRSSEGSVRITAIYVPSAVPSGQYTITYSVWSLADNNIRDTVTMNLNVLPVSKLAFIVVNKPDSVIAGEKFTAEVRIVNQSNYPMKAECTAENRGAEYHLELDPSSVDLAPGSSASLKLSVGTDKKTAQSAEHSVWIKVVGKSDGRVMATGGVLVSFDIIPRVTRFKSDDRSIPAQVVYRVAGSGDRSAAQVEVSGKGNIGEGVIDFRFIGPDIQRISSFGYRDEYWLNYSNRDLSVRLGDQAYGLSYLTDYYRYGRGFGFDYRQDPDSGMGMYYVSPEWHGRSASVSGSYFKKRLGKDIDIRLNSVFFNSDDETDPIGNGSTVSLETHYRPNEKTNMEMEIGSSLNEGVSSDKAYRLQIDGASTGGFHYSLGRVHAGPDYIGYYYDEDRTTAAVSIPVNRGLSASVNYAAWKDNLNLDPTRGPASDERLQQFTLRHDLGPRLYAVVGYNDFTRCDLLDVSSMNYDESMLRIGVGGAWESGSWLFDTLSGEHLDRNTGISSNAWLCRLFMACRAGLKQNYTFYGSLGSRSDGGQLLGGGNQVGFSANYRPSDRLDISARYTNYGPNSHDIERNLYELSLRTGAQSGSSWNLRLLGQKSTGDNLHSSYEITYTTPFSISIGKNGDLGTVEGTVSSGPGMGMSNVVLRMNERTAVTDSRGHFKFTDVPPGTNQLSIDRESIGATNTTKQKMPMPVEVARGSSSALEIEVVKSAAVSGCVFFKPDDGGAAGSSVEPYIIGDASRTEKNIESPRGIPNMIIELSNGEEALRRVTDQDGKFIFDDLRPGTWYISVRENNLPAHSYIRDSEAEIVLADGDSVDKDFDVYPRRRTIKMIGQFSVLQN